MLEDVDRRKELKNSGIYILIDHGMKVYIGQACNRKNGEGVLGRLREHTRKTGRCFWEKAIVFTTSDNSLSSTELNYIENKFCELAVAAKRYNVLNGVEPSLGNISEVKECELKAFIANARKVLCALNYSILEPEEQIDTEGDTEADKSSDEVPAKRESIRPNFTFSQCGIPQGATIHYVEDDSITATVFNDRRVSYKGKPMSLSALAQELKGKKSLQGPKFFTYNGKLLTVIREEKEDHGGSR